MSEMLVVSPDKTIPELNTEFNNLHFRRSEHETDSDLYRIYTEAIHFVLEQAVCVDPSLRAEPSNKIYEPTFARLKMAEPKKGLLK